VVSGEKERKREEKRNSEFRIHDSEDRREDSEESEEYRKDKASLHEAVNCRRDACGTYFCRTGINLTGVLQNGD